MTVKTVNWTVKTVKTVNWTVKTVKQVAKIFKTVNRLSRWLGSVSVDTFNPVECDVC
ncbi:hypothetical protein [Nostoc sp.]|uniref:hypothetical protein n=1 Tax=Nostoc sp. TaxID=1180 RepID=UPI002FFAAA26